MPNPTNTAPNPATDDQSDSTSCPIAFGLGIATLLEEDNEDDHALSELGIDPSFRLLDLRFLSVQFQPDEAATAVVTDAMGQLQTGHEVIEYQHIAKMARSVGPSRRSVMCTDSQVVGQLYDYQVDPPASLDHVRWPIVATVSNLDDAPRTAGDVYLRLCLLSMRHVQPNHVNLTGGLDLMFDSVWTSHGVFEQKWFEAQKWRTTPEYSDIRVYHQGRMPHMLDYVTPAGVRIANANQVCLGAYLAEGTTVTVTGSVDANAGTLGPSRIEGHIAAGVTVGKDCHLEVGSSLDITVADRVRVAAGHHVHDDSVVRITERRENWPEQSIVQSIVDYEPGPDPTLWTRATNLSGISDAIFRRNDCDGVSEVIPRLDRG